MKQIVSIIVCTFNRAGILPYCLDSLVDQTASPDTYEVIIVDNNSTDSTREIAEGFVRRCSNFRVILEPMQGLSHARNRGWQEAESDWIAYIDDDAKVPSDYVERVLDIIDKYDFDCFGGVYLPWYKYGKPEWFRDEYASNAHLQSEIGKLRNGSLSGGNIVFRRFILKQLGGFHAGIGMNGKKISYHEETLLQQHMIRNGYSIGFDPDLIIRHLVPRYKMTPWWFVRSSYARGRDSWVLDSVPYSWKEILSTAVVLFKTFTSSTIIATRNIFQKNYSIQNWIIDIGRPAGWISGKLVSMVRYSLKEVLS